MRAEHTGRQRSGGALQDVRPRGGSGGSRGGLGPCCAGVVSTFRPADGAPESRFSDRVLFCTPRLPYRGGVSGVLVVSQPRFPAVLGILPEPRAPTVDPSQGPPYPHRDTDRDPVAAEAEVAGSLVLRI